MFSVFFPLFLLSKASLYPPAHVLLELYMKPYEGRFSYNHLVILLLAFVCFQDALFPFKNVISTQFFILGYTVIL